MLKTQLLPLWSRVINIFQNAPFLLKVWLGWCPLFSLKPESQLKIWQVSDSESILISKKVIANQLRMPMFGTSNCCWKWQAILYTWEIHFTRASFQFFQIWNAASWKPSQIIFWTPMLKLQCDLELDNLFGCMILTKQTVESVLEEYMKHPYTDDSAQQAAVLLFARYTGCCKR